MANNVENIVFETDDDTFGSQVIEKSRNMPVIVQFYASWCMPCQMISPLLESVVRSHASKCVLAKVNIEESPYISNEYGIFSVPSVKLFMGGKIVSDFLGLVPEEFIKAWLDKNLNQK